ncbi:MAG TPA: exosortase system-associated protein, TIGR04073 family [Geobacter sp.]|nr:exosortase system-associated protein, TIGR04073 family [Geobacter sp.]
MGKRLFLMGFVVISLLCAGRLAQADSRSIDTASPQEVVDGMANKLVRGVANVGTGWLELPKQIYMTFKEEGVVKGMTVGPLKGIGMSLVRTVSGAGEAVTFFVAYPGFYEPYFDPAYVWQKE